MLSDECLVVILEATSAQLNTYHSILTLVHRLSVQFQVILDSSSVNEFYGNF